MALLGIDVGTSGCKTTIMDEQGLILSSAYHEYPRTECQAGYMEINPENAWISVCSCIYETAAARPGTRIAALSVSSFGEAAVPIDRSGKVLHNGILFTDPRGRTQVDALVKRMGVENLQARTGLPIHPMYSIFRAMWLRDNKQTLFRETQKYLQFEDYIIYRLTGEFATDYSLAARTMAFHVVNKEWDPEILEAAGLPCDLFARAFPSGTAVGYVSRAVAAMLGLEDKVLVVTGGHDQPCAALGGGAIHGGLAIDGLGTAECITICFDQPFFSPALLKNNYHCGPHVVRDKYITFAYAMSAGALLQWYRDTFAATERAEALSQGISIYALLDSLVNKEPSNLLILPHFSGSGTPYLDEASRGAILGLSCQTTSYDIYRAMLESITYEMKYNLECLETAGIPVKSLCAVGGGAKSDTWLQIKADILNRPVSTLEFNEAGTLGVGILAGVAAGIYKSTEEACKLMVREKRRFEPDPQRASQYEENYQRYRKLYPAIKSILG